MDRCTLCVISRIKLTKNMNEQKLSIEQVDTSVNSQNVEEENS